MIAAVVLLSVLSVTTGAVVIAYRERARLLAEVNAVSEGIERRTAPPGESVSEPKKGGIPLSPHLQQLLDEAVRVDEYSLAVLAVNELTGRASLSRSRGLLLARGLARIALLSGAGGAFVLVALGNFERSALIQGGASVLMGLSSSFLCQGLTASVRRWAQKYCALTDVLARELERQMKSLGREE